MKDRVRGAWLVHNSNKLAKFATQDDFESTYESGRAGVFLSALSQDSEVSLNNDKVNLLARSNNISHLEAKSLLRKLEEKGLVSVGQNGVTVLGIASISALEHTANIFDTNASSTIEKAALEVAEVLTNSPAKLDDFKDQVSDIYQLSQNQFTTLIERVESFGIVDYESVGGEKIYFNGNLFKVGSVDKIYKVIQSLTVEQRALVSEVDEKLRKLGFLYELEARQILGNQLMDKLNSGVAPCIVERIAVLAKEFLVFAERSKKPV